VKDFKKELAHASWVVESCDALLVGAGAGMGVDSGLPDFRGKDGFWKAYPSLEKVGIKFEDIANPRWFIDDPHLAWGFYGHRFNLYKETRPHAGFDIINNWIKEKKADYFIFTSNVDGHFQKAGFDKSKICECHGSLMRFQCVENCGQAPWVPPDSLHFKIKASTLRAISPLPLCPSCRQLARPNILMFSDWDWNSQITFYQEQTFNQWLERNHKIGIIEIGAGQSIPTVRYTCETAWAKNKHGLIRINPRDSQVPNGGISLQMGAAAALKSLDLCIQRTGKLGSSRK
jgi:NAD-dependent SIR2 family protein deacetylase